MKSVDEDGLRRLTAVATDEELATVKMDRGTLTMHDTLKERLSGLRDQADILALIERLLADHPGPSLRTLVDRYRSRVPRTVLAIHVGTCAETLAVNNLLSTLRPMLPPDLPDVLHVMQDALGVIQQTALQGAELPAALVRDLRLSSFADKSVAVWSLVAHQSGVPQIHEMVALASEDGDQLLATEVLERIVGFMAAIDHPVTAKRAGAAWEFERSGLDELARHILLKNDRGGRHTVPTDGMYPFQWNWDSAFAALGQATFDLDRAISEIETLFSAQWESGMVPHIVFHAPDPRYFPGPKVWGTGQTPPTSGITQPPVAASILLKLWNMTPANDALRARIKALFPRVLAWHRWFHRDRDPDRQGIVVMIHPWESGRDNSAEWVGPMSGVDVAGVDAYRRQDLGHADASMRPTDADYDVYIRLVQDGRECGWDQRRLATRGQLRVADVGMSMMLLQANRDLARLADVLQENDARKELESWIKLAEDGVQLLWDQEKQTFCSFDLIGGKHSGRVTNASFLSFFAGVPDEAQMAGLLAHWDRIQNQVAFMAPSLDPEDPLFEDKRYWRGPVWLVVNFMIHQGLRQMGLYARAERLKRDTRTLVEDFGFPEAYSPLGRGGTGGSFFTWTAAMWLAWAAKA